MKFLIAGGGTGGHYFPALAVASFLIERGHQVLYVGTVNGIEKKLGFPSRRTLLLNISGVVGRGIKGYFSSFRFVTSTLKILGELSSFQPDAAIVFGGYASLPSGLAAFLRSIPLYLQEQNSVPGRVNRLLSHFSRCTFLGFPIAGRYIKDRTIFTGNPVRKKILETVERREEERRQVLEKLGFTEKKKTLLILGGSQGALWINQLFLKVIPLIKGYNLQIVHLTGNSKREDRLVEAYRDSGIDARVFPFYERIWELYAISDAAVSRAGALAITELSLFGTPTLFIPYPYAADDHQLKNAQYLSGKGAAVCRTQEELSPAEAAEIVETLLFSIIDSDRIRSNFLKFSKPKATEEIVETVCRRKD